MDKALPDVLGVERTTRVRAHLSQVLKSDSFSTSRRASEFLEYIVAHALNGKTEDLRERSIGAHLYGRPIDYDTANDAVVRVRASEVRRRLGEYYLKATGNAEPGEHVQIVLPPGTYVPQFEWKAAASLPVQSGADWTEADPETALVQQPQRIPSRLVLVLACIGVAVLVWGLSFTYLRRLSAAESLTSIAVLPFHNLSEDKSQAYFAEGLTDELITTLGQVSALQVASRTSSSTYRDKRATAGQIRDELGVSALLEGSVKHDQHNIVVTVQLINTRTDREIWSHTYRRDRSDLLALESEIATAVAEQVQVAVNHLESSTLARRFRVDSQAQDLYLRALGRIDAGDLQAASAYLEQATLADPTYAQAHATLSLVYAGMGRDGTMLASTAFQKAKHEATTAQSLRDDLADSHVALARSAADLAWDWGTEEAELKKALALNPSSADALWAYTLHAERLGDFSKAIALMKRAITLDPVSSRVYVNAALIYHLAQQQDQALAAISLAGRFPHKDTAFTFPLGVIYIDKGLLPQAIEQLTLFGSHPYGLGHLGYAFALAHRTHEADQVLGRLKMAESTTGIGTYEEGLVYAGLGRRDEVFETLQRAYQQHDKGMEYLKVDPCFVSLHSDSRFRALIQRMHLDGDS